MGVLRGVLDAARQRAAGQRCAAPACGPESRNELGGLSRMEISQRARAELAGAIRNYTQQIDAPLPPTDMLARPWVITGHQVEFYHAGVWAKAVAVDALARQSGAVAIDLLVDHDLVEHLGLEVPVHDGDKWVRQAVDWADAPAFAADGIKAPTPEEFENWTTRLKHYPLVQTDALDIVTNGLREGFGKHESYTTWMSRGRKRLEEKLDVQALHVPTSMLCDATPWLAFVIAWAKHAQAWGQIYNAKLAEYRMKEGIKKLSHPMPDLIIDGRQIEMPFWVYHVGQPRARMVLELTEGGMALRYGEELVPLDDVFKAGGWDAADVFAGLLGEEGLVVRPRALTLTMFVRLFLADLFIHGIGGALYDQITNGILLEIFCIAPPYACVSAAWLLPLGQPLEASSVSVLRHQRHHLEHNPQLALVGRIDMAELVQKRREIIRELGDPAWRPRGDGHDVRRDLFRRLHAVNADLHFREPLLLGRIDQQIATAIEHEQVNKVLMWREYFFGLHTVESLRQLVNSIRK